LIARLLHLDRTPASSWLHACFISIACLLHLNCTPASSWSHACFILIARLLHLDRTPASSWLHACFISIARLLHLDRTPASSQSHACFILIARLQWGSYHTYSLSHKLFVHWQWTKQAFASVLRGNHDTPELLWTHAMRYGRLLPQLSQHLGDLRRCVVWIACWLNVANAVNCWQATTT